MTEASVAHHPFVMSGSSSNLICALFGSLVLISYLHPVVAQSQIDVSCAKILANSNLDNEDKSLLCKIYQQATSLEQMGAIVSNSLERFMTGEASSVAADEETRAKRKHEYLRFGKRKHEYLRFGKRKHEYLRFGRK